MSPGPLPTADAAVPEHPPVARGVGPEGAAVEQASPDADDARLEAIVHALARKVAQLQLALDSRVVIEQAKGVLAERYTVATRDAFVLLRRAARNNRISIHDLAERVVTSRATPPVVEAELQRAAR